MTDKDIRKRLVRLLMARNEENARIFEEVAVSHGSARADVVSVSEELECYEIKSEADSLKRLLQQGWHYGRAFNYVTLVAASKHIFPSMGLIPDWWGLIEVDSSGGLVIKRKAKKNPNQIKHGLSELLNRAETLSLLEEKNLAKGLRNKNMRVIHEKVAEIYDLQYLNDRVLSFFKVRESNLINDYFYT